MCEKFYPGFFLIILTNTGLSFMQQSYGFFQIDNGPAMIGICLSIFHKINNCHQFGVHSCQQTTIIQCPAVPPFYDCPSEIRHHQIFGLVVSDFAQIFVQGFVPLIQICRVILILGSYIYDVFSPSLRQYSVLPSFHSIHAVFACFPIVRNLGDSFLFSQSVW